MFASVVVGALNHLLASAEWATERLRPFAGQTARIGAGPLNFDLTVTGRGDFHAGQADAVPLVEIILPADAPLRYLADPASVFAAARLSGPADFAETLAFVFRNLRWDAEGDLARVIGDIPAYRLARVGGSVFAAQKEAARRLVANGAEYLVEEQAVLLPKAEVTAWAAEVDRLRDDVERLEKRLRRM